jgi:hypothetical protein
MDGFLALAVMSLGSGDVSGPIPDSGFIPV